MISQTPPSLTNPWCWRSDLEIYRGLSQSDRSGFLLLLEWFENFRLRYSLKADRSSAIAFWKQEVLGKDKTREEWQLDQWWLHSIGIYDGSKPVKQQALITAAFQSVCVLLLNQPVRVVA